MRLSNNLMYQNSINKILQNQNGVANAQERVNTGQKYLSTSEAPADISQAMLYTNKIQSNEQYTKNINQLNGRLKTEESVLQGINESIQAAKDIALKAGNGAYSKDDLKSLASELTEIQKTLANLMNTRSEDGKYIFSGYQDSTQPYQFDAASGKYNYQGDQGQHKITIAEGVSIKSSDNGYDTFEKTNARLNVASNTGSIPTLTPPNNITAGSVYVDKQGVFDQFHKEQYNADPTAAPSANTFNVVVSAGTNPGDPQQYEIQRAGNPLNPPVTGAVQAGEPIEFAGMKIQLSGAAPGQLDFSLEPPHKENALNTLQGLITGLNNGTLAGDDFQQVLNDGVTQLQNASEQVVFTQASLGGRMNVLERVTDSNSALDIQNQSNRSSLLEVDMAAAISELTQQETALQASQATFGRLAKLSLFDYI